MRENLMDIADSNLKAAEILFAYADQDENQLNVAAYHLQQALEMAMKYLIEMNGREYPKSHDIEQIMKYAKAYEIDLMLTDYIEDHAEMFSQWEAKSRYILSYLVERNKLEKAIQEVDSYFGIICSKLNKN